MNVTRVFDLLPFSLEHNKKEDMFSMKENGVWRKYSTEESISIINSISLGLLELGIKKDDKVAIMSNNRPHWNFADFAIAQIGATVVPLYPTLAEADLKFILNDAEVKIVFAGDADLVVKLNSVKAETPSLQEVYSFDQVKGCKHWTEVTDLAKGKDVATLKPYQAAVKPDDLLTLIYTSGTTGTPKGVMLTHNNLASNYRDCSGLLVPEMKVGLSFLPLSHIFERMVIYLYLYNGISVYYAESLETIGANLLEVKPHIFSSVPRLLEKVYDRIVAKGSELTGIKKKLFFWSLDLGLRYEEDNGWWYDFQLSIARKLVFKKWREALGGEIMAVVTGGAALQPRLAKVFTAAGVPVYQGYGLTETSPVSNVNRPGYNRFGTSGLTIPNVEVKIAADGEILVKGPNVMKGYYKRPDATAEAIDQDGWFHTGDIGEIQDGYLKITDRKKEIFKTSGGKYIAPQVMENKFKESPFIEQIIVIGEGQRFPAALVVPAFAYVKEWCEKKGIACTSNEELCKQPQVIEKIEQEIAAHNEEFGHWEQVKKFELLPKEFSIDGGEMTPKLSMKRKVIMEKYAALIEKIYL